MAADNAIVRRIREVAASASEALAVLGVERDVTYRQLVEEVDSVTDALLTAGVQADRPVALLTRRDDRLPAILLALWQVGAVVAFIDSTVPPTRLAECEQVVRPGWRITLDQEITISSCGTPVTCRGSHILFTSGTTGHPAAVLVGDCALPAALEWYAAEFQPCPGDRVALLAGLGHDPLLRDILIPLCHGGTLVVPPSDLTRQPKALAAFLRERRITILHTTPGLLELILAGQEDGDLDQLRLVVSAGAPLTGGLARRLRQRSGAMIVNAYGATETPQIASCAQVPDTVLDDPAIADQAVLSVGSGVAGAELLLAGDQNEVVVRSPHLALGYLDGSGREGRFADDPDNPTRSRVYRTGDRGERDPSGGIRIVGRIDRELSIDGHRIAPEEIEQAACKFPGIRAARASVAASPVGDQLALSVIAASGTTTDQKELRRWLRSVLPSHAVPSRIMVASESELDQNHKLIAVPMRDERR
jgi:acyl-coenzyme A synthetase/AMP-(fatty) acid ligase